MERLAQHRVPLQINATVTRHNVADIEALAELAQSSQRGIAVDPVAPDWTRQPGLGGIAPDSDPIGIYMSGCWRIPKCQPAIPFSTSRLTVNRWKA